jgi:hypothetical protein
MPAKMPEWIIMKLGTVVMEMVYGDFGSHILNLKK